MSKKIPKLIIYGITTIPTTTILACGESISIEDKSQLIIKTKSKQKDIIAKITIPTKDDKKHDAKLFGAIALVRKKVIKAINNAKTIVDAIKVGKDGVISLNKTIKNYKDSKGTEYKLLQTDKAKFSSFKHLIVGKAIPILKNGPTTAKELTALTGHGNMPVETSKVVRKFMVQTNSETGISTITITFTTGSSTDTTTYKISGFEKIDVNVLAGFMYQTKEGTIYVGTNSAGLKKLENNKLKIVDKTDVGGGFMYQTREGAIYVGTFINGLKKLENNELKIVDKTRVSTGFMYQTKEGTIYVGTYKGIKKLENDNTLTIVSTINVSFGFMYQTKESIIYVGTYNKGLNKLENNELKIVDKTDVKNGFMYQTKEGIIYVGTYNKGLKKFDGDILVNVVSDDVKNGFMYQTQDGTIYVGTNENGLKKLVDDGKGGKKLISIDETNVDQGFIYQTQDGTIYLGTSVGLKKFPKS